MIDLQKKFLKTRKDDPPKLGNFIQFYIEENKIKKKSVSDALDVLPTTLNQYFKQPSFQFAILWRISHAVKHNFLMELGEKWLKIPYETEKETALLEQLAQKNDEIKTLTTQLGVYKGIHKVE
ncbi:transcriptional regulator [Flavobacterium sp.]|uniref:transcriptional regulator n=1 Tax=Flavobacterium sp. TaxID=239 RepID=UPI0025EF1D9C|nr:transcriptional regulator [Flavobacterium sp.]